MVTPDGYSIYSCNYRAGLSSDPRFLVNFNAQDASSLRVLETSVQFLLCACKAAIRSLDYAALWRQDQESTLR